MSAKLSMKAKVKSEVAPWDKRLLLFFVAALFVLFLVLNREANTFLPDARLYPYVTTIMGVFLVALSVVRIIMGREPNLDAQSGKNQEETEEQTRNAYRKIVAYMAVFCCFYFSIWIVGFRISAVVFVFSFIRYFGHSYLRSTIYALMGLVMVEALSRLLSLELPPGFWHLLFAD
ncbi:hypothetical protein NBRC116493_22970 [Aurantivibrio infirmus]